MAIVIGAGMRIGAGMAISAGTPMRSEPIVPPITDFTFEGDLQTLTGSIVDLMTLTGAAVDLMISGIQGDLISQTGIEDLASGTGVEDLAI